MVISITASPRQDGQIRTVESWLASHAAWQQRPVTLAVTVPPPAPPPPKPTEPAPPAAAAPVATMTVPAPSGSAQQIALAMLASYGWSSSQFGCLDPLWARESGWNVYASNPDGAYGIPQAMPGSKMASAGPDWQTDAATQIRWGLNYIQAIYGSPCSAWSHEEATGWY
jgi:resuscitation-promoting factor RpfB